MRGNKQKTNNKTADLSNNILMITLHVNGPNTTIKRQRFSEQIQKMTQLNTANKKLTAQSTIYIQVESKRMEKNMPCIQS